MATGHRGEHVDFEEESGPRRDRERRRLLQRLLQGHADRGDQVDAQGHLPGQSAGFEALQDFDFAARQARHRACHSRRHSL